MVEYILRVDRRGRIVIPSEVRKSLGIGRAVKLRVRGKSIVIEPIEDPLEELSRLIEKVTIKASTEPWRLSKVASDQLMRESGDYEVREA